MKSFAYLTAVLALGLTLVTGDAEAAKRLGGGTSSGMQRQSVAPNKATNAAPAPTPAAPAAAPAAQPKRSWMGPLAGLAAGLGLAALASHFGFGEALGNMLMIGLLGMAVVMVIGYFLRKKALGQQPAMAGAGGMQYHASPAAFERAEPMLEPGVLPNSPSNVPSISVGVAAPSASAAGFSGGFVPADFDAAGFVRHAKVNFIRLQAANDAGNLDDIREFTTPEMFGEIKMYQVERAAAKQETDVLKLEAEVLDVSEEANRYLVSVRFKGEISEDKGAPEAFAEIWHMSKPREGAGGWVLAGIQQVE
jgi:predicted lipid-binding transport protein (Tim44 family)